MRERNPALRPDATANMAPSVRPVAAGGAGPSSPAR
jgi:hypothetical protein